MDAKQHLKELVAALDSSHISSWQTTAGWQKQLDAARRFLDGGKSESEQSLFRRLPGEACLRITNLDRARELTETVKKGKFVEILGTQYAATSYTVKDFYVRACHEFNFQEVFKL